MTLPRRAFLASLLAAPFIAKLKLPTPTLDVADWRYLAGTCKIDVSMLTSTGSSTDNSSNWASLALAIESYNKRLPS